MVINNNNFFAAIVLSVSLLTLIGCKSETQQQLEKAIAQAQLDSINIENERRRLYAEELIRRAKEEEEQRKREEANQYVNERANANVAQIAQAIRADNPSITVIQHDCSEKYGAFNAALKLDYVGTFSGDALSIAGKLVHRENGTEYFKFEQVSPDVLWRLSAIGYSENAINLFRNGEFVIELN